MELITKKVEKLIKFYGTNCPFKLANFLGIQVVYENLGKTLGYYSKHFRIKVIHINEIIDEKQQLFICAHELGHAIFHHDINTPFLKKCTYFSTDKIEIEANKFAVELLFSNETCVSIHEALEEYGVPKHFANYKCPKIF